VLVATVAGVFDVTVNRGESEYFGKLVPAN